MVDRDPNTIKQEIDQTRDQLAATIDSLAERANPRRLADDAKTRVIAFLQEAHRDRVTGRDRVCGRRRGHPQDQESLTNPELPMGNPLQCTMIAHSALSRGSGRT